MDVFSLPSEIKNYTIIGPLPPPLGGVSVYVRRHAALLRKEGYEVRVFDFKKAGFLKRVLFCLGILLIPKPQIYHLHSPYIWAITLLIARPFKKRIIYHDHRWEDVYKSFGTIEKELFQAFLNRCSKVILVGEHVKRVYEEFGFQLPSNTLIEYPFLPPIAEDEAAIVANYGAETKKFLDNHSPLLVANAYRYRVEGKDLYGIDLCLEAVEKLAAFYPRIGLIIAISDINPQSSDYANLMKSIDSRKIAPNVHIMISKSEIWPLFKRANLMLRPTLKDGASVSIAEALYFNCPVLASDVCNRGENVVLFKSEKVIDLVEKAQSILAKRFGSETNILTARWPSR